MNTEESAWRKNELSGAHPECVLPIACPWACERRFRGLRSRLRNGIAVFHRKAALFGGGPKGRPVSKPVTPSCFGAARVSKRVVALVSSTRVPQTARSLTVAPRNVVGPRDISAPRTSIILVISHRHIIDARDCEQHAQNQRAHQHAHY